MAEPKKNRNQLCEIISINSKSDDAIEPELFDLLSELSRENKMKGDKN